ncbi:MAG: dimethylarginine dimethylaminohydrolase family protein [Planctomycetota bacterium]|jgi:N-dimethylarginine dimethylaminohydrolase
MGDPSHFSVRGGANPHTRTRWGTKRRVDRARAIRQWRRLREVLQDLGVRVLVVPPDAAQPGLVYPANAGFMQDVDAERSRASRRFHLANLLPTRAGEKPHYERVLAVAGIPTATIDDRYRFEGEADFFPAGDRYLLTHGALERQRFVPVLAFPPWKRIYGFRTDSRVEEILAPIVAPKEILRLELRLEAHYHGDTVLCPFGRGRRFLLGYREGIAESGWNRLREEFGDDLISLESKDAACYAANSFALAQGDESVLLMPDRVSERLLAQVRERGVTPITVDVSEFMKKGGGSVKCMVADLGPVVERDLTAGSGSSK